MRTRKNRRPTHIPTPAALTDGVYQDLKKRSSSHFRRYLNQGQFLARKTAHTVNFKFRCAAHFPRFFFREGKVMCHKETFNVAEVAQFLFADAETVMQHARKGELPGAKIGKSWVFLREDILAFLKERIAIDTAERRAKFNEGSEPAAYLVTRSHNKRRKPMPTLEELQAIANALGPST